MEKVVIYTKKTCPYCVRAKKLLDDKSAQYKEIDVGDDPRKRAALTEKANGSRTVPQIFIGDSHVGGCDDLMELERSGKLDDILKG